MMNFFGKILCNINLHKVLNWDWTYVEYDDGYCYECEEGYCERCGKRFEK